MFGVLMASRISERRLGFRDVGVGHGAEVVKGLELGGIALGLGEMLQHFLNLSYLERRRRRRCR